MADLNLNFMHPTDSRLISVTLDSSMTGQETISELIAAGFIPASREGYNLSVKGGNQIDNNKNLSENQVRENDTIRVIPATDAGFQII